MRRAIVQTTMRVNIGARPTGQSARPVVPTATAPTDKPQVSITAVTAVQQTPARQAIVQMLKPERITLHLRRKTVAMVISMMPLAAIRVIVQMRRMPATTIIVTAEHRLRVVQPQNVPMHWRDSITRPLQRTAAVKVI